MQLDREQLYLLAEKYLTNTATPDEIALLNNWFNETEEGDTELVLVDEPADFQGFGAQLFQNLQQKIQAEAAEKAVIAKQSLFKRIYWRSAIAAAVIGLLGTGGYLLFSGNGKQLVEQTTADTSSIKDVAAPKGNRAVLTLDNGAQIELESTGSGEVATEGNTKVIKSDNGGLLYEPGAETAVRYNTLSVPKASNMASVTLADGTRVWLNVASSIRFPTAFIGAERKVAVTGEVYFEVAAQYAKDGKRRIPFIVEVNSKGNSTQIEVLGTQFNVNAYSDEPATRVSLLEGSVKLLSGKKQPVLLKPGQQGVLQDNQEWAKNQIADMEEVMAWKNGLFKFNKTAITSLLRQAERWYDIEVSYPNTVPKDVFSGGLSRTVSLSQFLKILEYSDIRAEIKNKTVIINP